MKRRTSRVPFFRSLLAFRLALGAVLAVCIWGFVYYTRITLQIQGQLAPGMEHPNDYYATGYLLTALVCVMFYYLTRAERIQPRIWKRARTHRAWAAARHGQTRSKQVLHISRFRRRRRRVRVRLR